MPARWLKPLLEIFRLKIRPKEILSMAAEAEKNGDTVAAATGFLRLAQYLLQRNEADSANKYVRHALRLHPNSVRGCYLSALAESILGNELKAVSSGARFAREAYRKKRIAEYGARIERDFKSFPAVRRAIHEYMLTLDRTDASYFILSIDSMLQARDFISAKATALALLKAGLNDVEAVRRLGQVLHELGNDAGRDFVASYEKGRMQKEDLVRLLESGHSGFSQSGAASDSNGNEERGLADLISDLEAELGVDDGFDKVEPLLLEFRRASQPILAGDSKARIDMATAYFAMGLHDAAESELKFVSPEDVRYLEAQCLLGELRFAKGQWLEALEIYQQCRRDERAPASVREESEYRMIQIHVRLGDRAGALTHLRNLEQLNPNYRDLRTLRDSVLGVADNELRSAKQ